MTKNIIKRICLSEELPKEAKCLVLNGNELRIAKESECKIYYYIEDSYIKIYCHTPAMPAEIDEIELNDETLNYFRNYRTRYVEVLE